MMKSKNEPATPIANKTSDPIPQNILWQDIYNLTRSCTE